MLLFSTLFGVVLQQWRQGTSKDLGTGKSYRLVGFSSQHKGGYELWNEETERTVVRGDVHHLRFFPSDLNTHSTTHNQPHTDSTSDNTTIVIDNDDDSFVDGFVYKPTGQSKHRAIPSQSLSLSRISHLNDSDSRNFSNNTSFGSSSTSEEQVGSRTPSGMREGDTDDTMSDPTILGRSARSVRGGEQWFTTSESRSG